MRHVLFGLVLLVAMSVLAQQPGQLPPPPHSTPPTFPEGQQAPGGQMPPDQEAPPQRLSNREAQRRIQQGLKSDPALRNSNISASVDQTSVVVTGTVYSEGEHDIALRIAQSFAGDRKLVDKLKIRQKT
jgi:hypothetical protein